MLNYIDEGSDLYSLSCLPVERLVWGSNRKLCLRGRNTPLTLWTIGYITNLWFFNVDGSPHDKVSVGVSPLTSHAMNVVRVIMGRLANPAYGTKNVSRLSDEKDTNNIQRSIHGWRPSMRRVGKPRGLPVANNR